MLDHGDVRGLLPGDGHPTEGQLARFARLLAWGGVVAPQGVRHLPAAAPGARGEPLLPFLQLTPERRNLEGDFEHTVLMDGAPPPPVLEVDAVTSHRTPRAQLDSPPASEPHPGGTSQRRSRGRTGPQLQVVEIPESRPPPADPDVRARILGPAAGSKRGRGSPPPLPLDLEFPEPKIPRSFRRTPATTAPHSRPTPPAIDKHSQGQ